MMAPSPSARSGLFWLLAAYGLWGTFPLYFKLVAAVPADEVLAHRIVWTVAFVGLVVLLTARWRAVVGVFVEGRTVGWLFLSGLLVAANWLGFVWAVANDRVLESSLGYYIAPLVSVTLGVVFLRERLDLKGWLAVALAAAGVAVLIDGHGGVPWVALLLAASWGGYGLVRKIVPVGPLLGLTVETLLLLPFALAYLWWIGGGDGMAAPGRLQLWLILSGVVTAMPLILFARAVKGLPMHTIGLYQFLVPTGHFTLAVVVFEEPFTVTHAITFALIWTALVGFSWSRPRVS